MKYDFKMERLAQYVIFLMNLLPENMIYLAKIFGGPESVNFSLAFTSGKYDSLCSSIKSAYDDPHFSRLLTEKVLL